jgi:monoamine oxidase
MLDVAIIGGGLCGLALAHSLQARRVDWALFEARPRLGGRVLSTPASAGPPLDLGPTWFWPATQPSITRLLADLGLASFAQPDDGRVSLLDDPNRAPRVLAFDTASGGLVDGDSGATPPPTNPGALHGGAHRLNGGMAALVDALAARLPAERLQRGRVLQALIDRGDHVDLQFLHHGEPLTVAARRVVLALPPRLAQAALQFSPALPEPVAAAMAATPTWMASAAKAAVHCRQATWRTQPGAGNAWVNHPQAVLAEVFDAGPADGSQGAALAGFLALGAAQRPAFRRGLPMLVDSQLAMLFGHELGAAEPQLFDWADEPYTCTEADRLEDARAGAHPAYGDPTLQQPLWQGRLWLGGSETARHGGGYLEGALAAAARLRLRLAAAANDGADPAAPPPPQRPLQRPAPLPEPSAANEASTAADNAADTSAHNDLLVGRFAGVVARLREAGLQRYRDGLHQALSHQQDDQLTQRALLQALESLYRDALAELARLPLLPDPRPATNGRHALTAAVLAPFQGLAEELLAEALRFNATSCALSNFVHEHRPTADYVQTIRRDLAAAWAECARDANQRLWQGPQAAETRPATTTATATEPA